MSQDTQTQAPAAPKKGRPLLLIGALVVIVATIGAGAYWMYGRPAKSEPVVEEPKPSAVISQDPFVVNLTDTGNPRFLRVTLGLVVDGDDTAKELLDDPVARMALRSSILELLSQQTAARLVSAEGKAELKKAIAQRASTSVEHLKVTDVLFTEFIVQ